MVPGRDQLSSHRRGRGLWRWRLPIRAAVVAGCITAIVTSGWQPPRVAAVTVEPIRACRYIPGKSTLASMPPDQVRGPQPRVVTSPASSVSPAQPPTRPTRSPRQDDPRTTGQLAILDALSQAVLDHYAYPDFLGHDWAAITGSTRSIIRSGIEDDEALSVVLQGALDQLGDDHSQVQSPAAVREAETLAAGQTAFVGIGAMAQPIDGTDRAVVMVVLPDSPAAEAGLLPHDAFLAVDGGPIRDEHGLPRTLGPAGTSVALTVQRPGEPVRDITLTRRRVAGSVPIDACIVPGTRIGYIFLPTFRDESIDDQVRAALVSMTTDGPLEGLVLDDRMNGGGLGSVAEPIMGMFASGNPGAWVHRDGSTELELTGEDVGGSQTLPLVVLVGRDTISYGEIMAGVLRVTGRATILGEPTDGNVEQLHAFDLGDGWRAWLATDAFRPVGEAAGVWERTGIIPDIYLPTRWDLFTEATDPALAAAVELLLAR